MPDGGAGRIELNAVPWRGVGNQSSLLALTNPNGHLTLGKAVNHSWRHVQGTPRLEDQKAPAIDRGFLRNYFGGPISGPTFHSSPIVTDYLSHYGLLSCPSWVRTRTLLIQSPPDQAGISDNLLGIGHFPSIGARFPAVVCPLVPGETTAKLRHPPW